MKDVVYLVVTLCSLTLNPEKCGKDLMRCYSATVQLQNQHRDGDGSRRGLEIADCFAALPNDEKLTKNGKFLYMVQPKARK